MFDENNDSDFKIDCQKVGFLNLKIKVSQVYPSQF